MSQFITVFWNSPELLSAALKWLTISGIVLTAIFGAAIFFVNDRIGSIQADKIEKQSEQIGAQEKTVKAQDQKIRQQIEQIGQLDSKAEELALRAQNAERGVSDTYDFNGGHRQNAGDGRTMLTVGPETSVFQTMITLNASKDWQGCRNRLATGR